MELEKLKQYLQIYLDTAIKPKIDKKRIEMGFEPIDFTVNSIVKGSYQPPIYHIFLDTEPVIQRSRNLRPHASIMLTWVQEDVQSFFKMFSMNFPTKIHWNKRPIFKNDTLYTED